LGLPNRIDCIVAGEAFNIIDHVGTEVDHCAHDLGLSGVDRQGHTALSQSLQHGLQASQLRFDGYYGRTGASGLGTEVQKVSALIDHAVGGCDGSGRIEPPPAVRKGVGREVEDAHNQRPLER
jgi:hypothetical protein